MFAKKERFPPWKWILDLHEASLVTLYLLFPEPRPQGLASGCSTDQQIWPGIGRHNWTSMPGQVCRSVLHLTDWVLFLHVSLLYWDLWNLFISSLLFVSNVHCCSLLFSEHHCLGSHMSDGSQQMCKNTSYIDFCPFGAQLNVSLYIYKYFLWCTYSYMPHVWLAVSLLSLHSA